MKNMGTRYMTIMTLVMGKNTEKATVNTQKLSALLLVI